MEYLPAYKLHLQAVYFGKHLQEKKQSSTTIAKHKKSLKKLLSDLEFFNKDSMDKFISEGVKKGLSTNYLNQYIFVCRLFSRYLIKKGYSIDEVLVNYPQFHREDEPQTGSFNREEMDYFLSIELAHHESRTDFEKWQAFFAIMAYTGMFPKEVATLRKENIDLKHCVVKTESHSVIQPRNIPIPKKVLPIIKRVYDKTENGKLLFGRKLNPSKPEMSVNWFYNFHRTLRKMGISKEQAEGRHLTTLAIRNFYIEEVLKKGTDFMITKTLVGHSDIRTTLKYAKRIGVSPKKLTTEVDKVFD